MTRRLIRTRRAIRFFLLCFLACVLPALAQANQSKSIGAPPRPPDISGDKSSGDEQGPLTSFEEELRAKRLIKIAEKEHQENVDRARELCQIGQDLKDGLKTRSSLDREDAKKVERLEKLTKKIRGEAGGEDDDVQLPNAPSDIQTTVLQIADNANLLSKDVQNTPRQVVSAAVIDRANVLLQLVKILRGFLR